MGENIRQSANGLGADLVGFADVSCLPVEIRDGLTRAVSVAVALDPASIRDIAAGPTAAYFAEYERANTLLDRRGDDICEMKRLFVRPAHQGRGIGRALANAIIEEARRIGYKHMRLDTVLEPARNLYRSLGFREIPPYQHVPVEGVVFMELEL